MDFPKASINSSRPTRLSSTASIDAQIGAGVLAEGVFQEAPEGADAISPADFLSFFVGASPIADADFIDAEVAFGDLDGDFRLKAEAVFFDGNRLQDVAAEDLVASLHVCHVHIGQGLRSQG